MRQRTAESLPEAVETIENLWIPLKDGGRLAARAWIPKSAGIEPVPVIMEYIPYRKRDITRIRDSRTHPYLAAHGYACVRVDLRGSGDSDGVMTDQYREQELDDGVQAIQWLAAQPWCNGLAGMMGISWGGFNSLQVAARRPPALKAIISACSTDDLYADNMHHMGGCLLTDNLSESTTMQSFNSCPPDPEIVGEKWRELWLDRLEHSGLWIETWLQHQWRDDYWRDGSICEDYSAISCPVMAVGGWADGFTNAIFRLLEHLDVPRLGLIGPWGHKYPHVGIPGPSIGFLQEALRWWDYWLKGRATGIMDEPMLRAWMQDSVPPHPYYKERPGRWVGEDSWPSPNIELRRYQLGRNRLLGSGEKALPDDHAALSIQSPLSVGLFAGKWCAYTAAPDLPHDQREEDGGALVFHTAPLEHDLQMLGAAVLEAELTANRSVAMIAVRLSDVAPDDKATRVTYGLLNLNHRNGSSQPEGIQPGETMKVEVALNYVAQTIPAGHRLRVSISTSYWPLAWPSPAPVRLTINPGNSTLVMPVREPQKRDLDIRFEEAEGCVPATTTQLQAQEHNWLVHRDLATDRSVLEVIKDNGVYRINELDLVIGDTTRDWYSYERDDYDSLRGETKTVRSFSREGWSVRTRTRTVLTATPVEFELYSELDAWEGDRRIFSKNWHRRIPRDYL